MWPQHWLSKNGLARTMLSNPHIFPDLSYPHWAGTSPVEVWTTGQNIQAGNAPGTQAGLAVDTLQAFPFYSGRGGNLDRIAIEVTTEGGAGSVSRFGIYTSTSNDNLYPSTLLVDSGEFDTSAVGGIGVKSVTISVKLYPNRVYWAIILFGTASPTIRIPGIATAVMGDPSTLSAVHNQKITATQTYGALPSSFPAGGTLTNGIIGVWMRFSS